VHNPRMVGRPVLASRAPTLLVEGWAPQDMELGHPNHFWELDRRRGGAYNGNFAWG